MSFGGGGKTTQQQTSQQAYDPTQVGLVDANAQGVAQQVATPGSDLSYTPYTGAGLSFSGGDTLTDLTGYTAPTATATGYTAPTATATGYTAPTATATGYTAATIDPNAVNADTQSYLNPYTSDVVDTTAAQLARQNNIDNTTAAGQATAAGAFGGSRSAVLQNLNTDSYQRNLDSTVAGLNSAGYTQAQQAALDTAQANQGAQNTAFGFNAGAQNTASLANQATGAAADQFTAGAQNTASLANQQAGAAASQFTAGAQNTASLANQQADEQAATTKLSALGLSAEQAQAVYGANWAQYVNSQTDPVALQQLVNQAYGLTPQSALTTSQGTSSSRTNPTLSFGSTGFNPTTGAWTL